MEDRNNIRFAYVARYGKDAWARAVTVAARHRLRASNEYGLTEHWTAWEWLDLCALWAFQCPFCRANVSLSPHHLLPLSKCGDNTIANIVPTCTSCHIFIHEHRFNWHPQWLALHSTLAANFQEGDFVDLIERWAHPDADAAQEARQIPMPKYVITEIIPASQRASLSELAGLGEAASNDGIHIAGSEITYWTCAKARVAHTLYQNCDLSVALTTLTRVDIASRQAVLGQEYGEQQQLYVERQRLYAVGDWVTFSQSGGVFTYGVILRFIPPLLGLHDVPLVKLEHIQVPRWPFLRAASVRLKYLTRKGYPACQTMRVDLANISKADMIPPLDEQWRAAWEAWTAERRPRSLGPLLKILRTKTAKPPRPNLAGS